jgi:predicted aldo/keto reductase-like oxidoreductase
MVTGSMVKRMSYDMTVSFLTPAMEMASTCTECGECAERCPYDLKIPDLLKTYRTAWGRFLETREWAL